jgi:Ca2+-binding RTX toxin-like protein
MPLTRSITEQAILDIVASDFAYKPDAQIAVGVDRLRSFPDSTREFERGFPPSLVSALDNSPTAATHRNFVASGISVVEFDNWAVTAKFDDPGDGFGAVVFKSRFLNPNTGKFDYIVSFRGTDGLNAQDWYGNLDLAKNVWDRQSNAVMSYVLGTAQDQEIDQATLGRIHFTGQSAGGGLAQYAAYTYASERKRIEGRFDSAGISLVTFNAFGSVRGLQQLNSGIYDTALLAGVETAHFVIDNEIVHRLGAGDQAQLAAVGGSWHVNGKDNTYQFDFLQKQGGELVRDSTGRVLKLDLVSAHRTEAGFYAGFDNFQNSLYDFTRANRVAIDYLDSDKSQSIGAALSRIANKGLTTESSATARLIVGLTAIGVAGDRKEIRTFGRALLESYYASADVPTWRRTALEVLAFPEVVRLLSIAALPNAIREGIVALGIETLGGLNASDKTAVWDGINSFLSGDNRLNRKDLAFNEAVSDREKALMHELVVVGAASRFAPAEIDEILLDPRQREAAKALAGVQVDTNALLNQFASGADWLRNSLVYLQQVAADSGKSGEALVAFDVPLVDLLNVEKVRLGAGDGAFQDKVAQAMTDFVREDFGWALANAKADFTVPFHLARASVLGTTQFDFIDYDRIHDALVEARNDPRYALIQPLIDEALSPIESAGETVVIGAGRDSNPFDRATFDPGADPIAAGSLEEGSLSTFTAYLPYEAESGGQRVRLQLAGTGVEEVSVLADDAQIELEADGSFTLTVTEGQREATFSLVAGADFDADANLTLSAQLVNAAGEATHLEHEEAQIGLDAEVEIPPGGGREIRGDWAPKPYTHPDTGETYYAVDDLGNIERLPGQLNTTGFQEPDNSLDGSSGADHIVIGDFEEQVYGYAGNDAIKGSELRGSVFFGGAGDDWLEALGYTEHAADYLEFPYLGRTIKLGEDKLYGGAGNDRIYGESEVELASLYEAATAPTNLPGDWASGGSGADEVYGGAGDDVLMGGSGEDRLVGGAGMDVVLGDEHFLLRPEGNFWRVLHPNFGDFDPYFGGFEIGLFPVVNATLNFPDMVFPQTGDPDFAYYKNGGGADVLIGGAGEDILIGQAGDDTLYGGEDDDIVAGWEGADQIFGGSGSDLLAGDFGRYEQMNQRTVDGVRLVRPGVLGSPSSYGTPVEQISNDFIDGGAGDDRIWGEGGSDVILGGEGNDILYGDATYLPDELHGADLIDGGAGEDELYGGGSDDRLFGGADNDYLSGEAGSDQADGGAGDDYVAGGEADDVLKGSDGADVLSGDAGMDVLWGGSGGDQLDGGADDDVLHGEAGMDLLSGGNGNDSLYGGSGGDVIEAGAGNDLIDGGVGIDVVRGGAGDDTYVFSVGYGRDLIEDTQGESRIRFGFGITPEALNATLDAASLSANVNYGFGSDIANIGMDGFQLGGIDFADGSSWSQKQFLNLVPALATEGSSEGEVLTGNFFVRNELRGLAGEDLIIGSANNDRLEGGDGADDLQGGAGSDAYVFAAGENGTDVLTDSELAASTYLEWFYANLSISDWAERGQHGGKYKVEAQGDGGTFARYYDSYEEAYADYPYANISLVEPLSSIAPLITRDDAAGLDSLFAAGVLSQDIVEFDSGISLSDLTLAFSVRSVDAANYPDQPWHAGGTLSVHWGAGAGFDVAVPDVNYGFSGSNLLTDGVLDPEDEAPGSWRGYRLGEGIEAFKLADGSTYTLERILQQATVVEVLEPYHFFRESGVQLITRNHEAIVFEDFIRSYEVYISRDGLDLLLSIPDGSQGRIPGWYSDPDLMPATSLQFSFDAEMDAQELTDAGLTVFGTESDDFVEGLNGFSDRIFAGDGNDVLSGGSGNDEVSGGYGDDLLAGGPGDDALSGGAGVDVYLLESGGGHDTAFNPFDSSPLTEDVIRGAPGVTPEDTLISRDSFGLSVWLRGSEDRIELPRWFTDPNQRLGGIEFADGTFLDAEQMEARLEPAFGTSGDDAIFGSAGDDVIDAGAGDDEVFADGGDDLVDAGPGDDYVLGEAGNDIIVGGAGADDLEEWDVGNNLIDAGADDDYVYHEGTTFVVGGPGDDWIDNYGPGAVIAFNAGDGNDVVYAADSFTLSLGGGVESADLSLSENDAGLLVSIGANDSVRLSRELEDDPRAWPEITLQMFGSVHTFDLNAVIEEFYAALGDDPSLAVFALDGVLQPYEISYSESSALGGALAWQYATSGATSGLSTGETQSVLADPDFGSVAQSIFLDAGNSAPEVSNPMADQSASEDSLLSFTVPQDAFTDPDAGDTLAYSVDDLPAWLSFDAETQTFTGTPLQADVGTLEVRLTATDTAGLSVLDEFTLTIANANDAPVLANPIADQGATEDLPFAFEVPADTFADEDPGDSLGYSSSLADGSPLPAWLAFGASLGTFTGVPGEGEDGTLSVLLTAIDAAGASVSDVFHITVAAVNDAPIVVNRIADWSANEDAPFELTVPVNTFADPDAADTLTYPVEQLPAWLSFDAETRSFSGTPLQADVGSVQIRVIATDTGGLSVSDDFILTVENVNDAPVAANPIADQTATEDASFELRVPGDAFADEDPDDALAWFASRPNGEALPRWLAFDAATRALSGTPSNDDVGSVSIELTATDASGASASDVFDITVANVNDAPTLEAPLANLAATEDQALVVAVPARTFSDVDAGDALTLSAAELPSWLTFDADTQTFSGTPRNADVGSYDIRLTATDTVGAAVSDLAHLDVANVNDAPTVANPIAEQSFEAGSPFGFAVPSGTFTDEDAGDALTLSAALYGGGRLPAWLSFDPATATFSGDPGKKQNGISQVSVTATDRAGASVSTDFGLVIRARAGSAVIGARGDDVMYGGDGNEALIAKGGNDALFGGAGNDLMQGGGGQDLLQGGDGADMLHAGSGHNLLDGGAGNDMLFGGRSSSVLVGGTGNDTIRTGHGNDVILFNRGDGSDTVLADHRGDNTLSFGGGITYSDLALSRHGKDLVVSAGQGDRVVLENWYAGKQSVLNLQIVLDASDEFDAGSSDPLYNKKVQSFDFLGMVRAFDHARRESPGLTSWAVTNALLQFHLSGADDAALGGDLAYWYGRNRGFGGISLAAAQQVIGAAGFGSEAQSLRPFAGLQEGFVKLT